jgi:hypothetical protein
MRFSPADHEEKRLGETQSPCAPGELGFHAVHKLPISLSQTISAQHHPKPFSNRQRHPFHGHLED